MISIDIDMKHTSMLMPTLQEYDVAVDHLAISAGDPELAKGYPRKEGNRLIAYTGGLSRVYPVRLGDRTIALRCWHNHAERQALRYQHLAGYLPRVNLPCLISDIRYV